MQQTNTLSLWDGFGRIAVFAFFFAPMANGQSAQCFTTDDLLLASSSIAEVSASITEQQPLGKKPIPAQIKLLPNLASYSRTDHPAPQTTAEKLRLGLTSSFSLSSVALSAMKAGLNLSSDSYPAFGQGGSGYSRYLWHGFVDQAVENMFVQSLLPIALHQDSRYYAMRTGSITYRTAYALSRTLITRTDSGHEVFNASEVIGAGAAAGISSAYYPGQYRTWSKTGQRWLGNVLVDGAFMLAREFLPDIAHAIFRRR